MALTDPGVTLVEHRRHRFVPLSDAKALTKASARSVGARGYRSPRNGRSLWSRSSYGLLFIT
jgi:hypothetical protein